MDWSKTKTIFIITFLVLDIFLVYQLFEKNKNKYEYISESSIVEKLAEEDIRYAELVNVELDETYITGSRKLFSEDDFKNELNQNISLISEHSIISILNNPISLNDANFDMDLRKFLKDYVAFGDFYRYGGWNRSTNKLLFFQIYNDRPIYFNESGMLSVQLDEDNRIIGYEQTMLEDIEEIYDETNDQVLYAEKALESLYNNGYLKAKSNVSSMKLGYYNVVPVSGDIQFFAPTWHIVVDGTTNYFVNAVEGQVIELIQSGVENHEFSF